jgi:hypothetical protein
MDGRIDLVSGETRVRRIRGGSASARKILGIHVVAMGVGMIRSWLLHGEGNRSCLRDSA